MIRRTIDTDYEGIVEVALRSGLFDADQLDVLTAMIREPSEQDVWFADLTDDRPTGVAYLAPEKFTEGTWNLYFIAVHPDNQRRGRGKAILEFICDWLIREEQRMLIIETAGIPDFQYVRDFYAANGFENEGRIRDFYAEGVDKVIFRKLLP